MTTTSACDIEHSERCSTSCSVQVVDTVRKSMAQDPETSIRRVSLKTDLICCTTHSALIEKLYYRARKLQLRVSYYVHSQLLACMSTASSHMVDFLSLRSVAFFQCAVGSRFLRFLALL